MEGLDGAINSHYVLLHMSFNIESKKIVIHQVLSLNCWLLGGIFNSERQVISCLFVFARCSGTDGLKYLKECRSSPKIPLFSQRTAELSSEKQRG